MDHVGGSKRAEDVNVHVREKMLLYKPYLESRLDVFLKISHCKLSQAVHLKLLLISLFTMYACISFGLIMFTQNDGRLRFSKQNVVYKSSKTGKVDSIPAGELNLAQWRRVCLGHGIKLGTSTGHIYKYDGFRDTVGSFCVLFFCKIWPLC